MACCHKHNEVEYPPDTIDEPTRSSLQCLSDTFNFDALEMEIAKNEEIALVLLKNKFVEKVVERLGERTLPSVVFDKFVEQAINMLSTIAKTKYGVYLLPSNTFYCFIPFAFDSNVSMECIYAILSTFCELIIDEESALIIMNYHIFPLVMIWLEFGNEKCIEICLQILNKLFRVQKIVDFACSSQEKIDEFMKIIQPLQKNLNYRKMVNTLISSLSKNDLFSSQSQTL
ncbi:hypothetical protein EIN_485540 [Entamoeba invadens IP1]|uniref:Uncharacterized protein n=1 Tax=Entamoeba invadens IP1 TaxID=370355 RepID=A0A0A1U4H1_ENTIV|nr:hypothetical protein EIN_485540 [Entamoeba invadens IP1]ELP89162.1 hypothetical protein EIN_485540 [Entamoeba invadens IP1]|eukprot:XP_004255933.1 hypothetical protein EIN_485540 [Entamoeba invadens IP1]